MSDPLLGMSDVLRSWRLRRDPRDVLELNSLPAHLRSAPVLTQAIMALLTGVSERHYRRLETQGGKNFSRGLVAQIARILALNEAESTALYIWTAHEPPPPPAQPGLDASLIRFLDEQTHAAYYSDDAYDILGYNGLAALHFPWITAEGANIMQWGLGETGRGQCVGWEEYWAAPMIAQLRLAAIRHPDNVRLREVIRDVRLDPDTRRLWDDERSRMAAHAHGDIRPITAPTLGTTAVWIQLLAFTPLHRPDLRLVVVSPLDPGIREPRSPGEPG